MQEKKAYVNTVPATSRVAMPGGRPVPENGNPRMQKTIAVPEMAARKTAPTRDPLVHDATENVASYERARTVVRLVDNPLRLGRLVSHERAHHG